MDDALSHPGACGGGHDDGSQCSISRFGFRDAACAQTVNDAVCGSMMPLGARPRVGDEDVAQGDRPKLHEPVQGR